MLIGMGSVFFGLCFGVLAIKFWGFMPLTKKGLKIREALQKYYGKDKGESVMYALINKGKVKGAEKSKGSK